MSTISHPTEHWTPISAEERELGEKLLFSPETDTAARFAGLYRDKSQVQKTVSLDPKEKLRRAVIDGAPALAAQAALAWLDSPIAMAVAAIDTGGKK